MSLPKWIEEFDAPDCNERKSIRLGKQALCIAYQALEAIRFGSLEATFSQCTQTAQEIAEEALRRIEELGK